MSRTLAVGLLLFGRMVAVSAEPPNELQMRIDEEMDRAKMQLLLVHEMRIAEEMERAKTQRQLIQLQLTRLGLDFERDGNVSATRKLLDSVLATQIANIDRACSLSDSQKRKLR